MLPICKPRCCERRTFRTSTAACRCADLAPQLHARRPASPATHVRPASQFGPPASACERVQEITHELDSKIDRSTLADLEAAMEALPSLASAQLQPSAFRCARAARTLSRPCKAQHVCIDTLRELEAAGGNVRMCVSDGSRLRTVHASQRQPSGPQPKRIGSAAVPIHPRRCPCPECAHLRRPKRASGGCSKPLWKNRPPPPPTHTHHHHHPSKA